MKNFDWIRAGLLIGMVVVAMMLIREWDAFQTQQILEQRTAQTQMSENSSEEFDGAIPSAPVVGDQTPDLPVQQTDQTANNQQQTIRLVSDVLALEISLVGGDITGAQLLNHLETLDAETPFTMLVNNGFQTYVAQSGLVGTHGTDRNGERPRFVSVSNEYTLAEGQDSVAADLVYQQGEVTITKRFTLTRGDDLVSVDYLINNHSSDPWSGAFYAQIKRDSYVPEHTGGFGAKPYVGAAITTPDDRYQKISFSDMEKSTYRQSVDTGWAAMLQHYFLSAWIPDPERPLEYSLRKSSTADLYYVGFAQPALTVAPGSTGEINAAIYIGPKDQYRLAEIAPSLDLTVDYGWLWWISQPLFWLLQKIQSFVGNWGVAIILLTVTVKLLFYKLSETSYRSMARMRKLQPKMTALKERLGDDRQAFSQEMMKLYQKEKVNPVSGCLPMLIQMPVFIALYWVLQESVELRHAPFALWIHDLSAKDPLFILPILMGASMFFQMRLNPTPPDPMQAKVMQFMPIMFTVMFMWFPAGLVLYWTCNNLLSMAQQWVITKRIESADA